MTTATRKRQSKRPDPLIAELLESYGIATETELHARLKSAEAWAKEHGVRIGEGCDEGAMCVSASAGRMVSQYAGRVQVDLSTDSESWKSAAHRRLLTAALALFLMTHPVTRRNVEAGRHCG